MRLIAVVLLCIAAAAFAQQQPTPEQRIAFLEARLAASQEELAIASARKEELGALIRLERAEAKAAAEKCAKPVTENPKPAQ